MKSLLEEVVLAGVGVLLVFLGVFSKVPLTNITAVGIGAFLFYIAYFNYRNRTGDFKQHIGDGSEEESSEAERYGGRGHEIEEQIVEIPTPEREHFQFNRTEFVPQQQQPHARAKISAADFFEEKQNISMSYAEPQSEFTNLLLKVLAIVKEVCFAHSVTFFWVKTETRQLIVEGKISDSDAFTQDRKISLGLDVVSKIGLNGQPQIVNNILPETERDVLCYYKNLQGVKSFVGVPIFYAGDSSAQSPIAVLAVDSKAEDAYGDETFAILSHTATLISSLLISYTEKYDLSADVKLVEADTHLKKKISIQPSITLIINSLAEELENIISWDSISVVLFDDAQRAWAVASARVRGNDRFVSPKQLIDFEGGIVGHSIKTNSVQTINLAQNSKIIFNENERSSEVLKQGTLVSVPFSSGGKCFGAVVVSNRKANSFSKKDISSIQSLSTTIAPAFEIAELNMILSEHIAIDEQTGTLSKKYFVTRLNEELHRASDREEDLSLVFVSVSNLHDIEQRYGAEGKEAALIHVARHLRASVRLYDVVGRFDASTFGVILGDTIANDAFMWAEKLRTAIAGSIVSVDKRSFSLSVTIGISGASAKMLSDELIKNVTHVLEQAKKAGGNIARVF
ncbi:MAG: diguanylate cyclase [Bacteroidota bacterium]|nr:diguanylate cyclase [Bacteroidota bacterium]